MSLPVLRKNPQGKVFVNPAKRYTKPYWLTTDPKTVTVAGNGTSDPIPMIVDQTGHVEIAYLLYQADGAFNVTIFDPGRRYSWQNKAIHIDNLAGTAQKPLILPETYFLNVARGSRQLTVQFTDLSGSSNDIRFAMHGRRFIYNEAPADVYKKFQEFFSTKERTSVFFITTEEAITSLAAGADKTTEFRVTSDAFFEIVKMTAVSNVPFEFELEEYSSGRKLMPFPIRGEVGFGTAEFPFILFESYLLERDYRIRVKVTNLHASTVGKIYLTLIGRRIPFLEEARQ